MRKSDDLLQAFFSKQHFSGKGALCVALVVTRHAKEMGLPLDPDKLLTEGGGQVLGLGKGRVQAILKDHGISKTLAEEGGRTSRGGIGIMRAYVAFLNGLAAKNTTDLDLIEAWWIAKVKKYFNSKPFALRFDPKSSMRAVIRDLLQQAVVRQKGGKGTMYLGAMLQHLVGAKLELVLGCELTHYGSSVADAVSERTGDFIIEDVVIHVTAFPGEAVMRKCQANLEHGLRPIVITTWKGVTVAEGLADNLSIGDRVDFFDAEQFLAGNVFELAKFAPENRRAKANELVEHYNRIVEACETDPSLHICVK
jgi:hypothetical protein